MKQLSYTILLLLFVCRAGGQPGSNFGLIHHSLEDKRLGHVDFYLSDTLHGQKKPLLIYLDGSGNRSLYFYQQDSSGRYRLYSTLPFNFRKLALKYHILLISKPHTQLADTMHSDADMAMPGSDALYNKYASLDWRVEATSKALDFIMKNYPVERRKIAVFGYSEGAQVAPALALFNRKITHCIAFAGGGLSQFFDEIIAQRMAADKGSITHVEAQQKIDGLYAQYAAIFAGPANTDSFWYGHTYRRWASYAGVPAMECYRQLTIPLYIVQGTADESTQVLSADYIKLEFLRLHKTNLTYRVYPGCNHMLYNPATGEDHLFPAIEDALAWLDRY